MPVLTSISTIISPSSIPGDFYDPADPEFSNYFPSVFKGDFFEFQIVFSYQTSDEIPVPGDILNVSFTSPFPEVQINVTSTNPSSFTLRIIGPITSIFLDEIFRFLLSNRTLVNLPSSTTEEFDTIVSWSAPVVKIDLAEYTFEVDFDDPVTGPGSSTIEFEQFCYWNFVPSLNSFSDLVTRGKF